MKKEYYYDLDLPEKVTSIIDREFWVYDHVSESLVRSFFTPVKFSSFTSIFLRKGRCKASINLMEYDIEAPCIVNVWGSHILQPSEFSADFEAAFLVIDNNIKEEIFSGLVNTAYRTIVNCFPVVPIPEEDVSDFSALYDRLRHISGLTDNPFLSKVVVHTILSFFFTTAYKSYRNMVATNPEPQGHLVDLFIQLVQKNFKKERFLEYYASKLDVTPKHLSRSVKKQTGYTAVEWIERFVILEAKAMLKSSSMNIQQIADELNFPSHSFFGKYFKKYVGMTPTEFRNS